MITIAVILIALLAATSTIVTTIWCPDCHGVNFHKGWCPRVHP